MEGYLKIVIAVFVLAALVTFGMGTHKIVSYENPSSEYTYEDDEMVNAYVEGDAYNYIINSTRATAYYVLTGTFLLSAIGSGILLVLLQSQTSARRETNPTTVGADLKNPEAKPPT